MTRSTYNAEITNLKYSDENYYVISKSEYVSPSIITRALDLIKGYILGPDFELTLDVGKGAYQAEISGSVNFYKEKGEAGLSMSAGGLLNEVKAKYESGQLSSDSFFGASVTNGEIADILGISVGITHETRIGIFQKDGELWSGYKYE